MKTLSEATETILENIKVQQEVVISTSEPLKQQQGDICEQKIQTSNEDKKKLTRLVTACYEGLNVYGKSPEQLEASIMLMQMTLGRFPYDVVREAFSIYLQTGATMPTPADIIKIVEKPIVSSSGARLSEAQLKRLEELRKRDRQA